MPESGIEDLLRTLSPQVLGAVVRRYGHFDLAEDATQEALLAAATQWPAEGRPENPRAWLVTVASRRLTDLLRAEQARRRREDTVFQWRLPEEHVTSADDTLVLLFLCCHPSLSPASQIALTLRAVGGLTTAEIARAFLVPEATMTRRISRAKAGIKASGVPFALPAEPGRLDAVLHVLYLIFNEGYASTSGPDLVRSDLSAEAIRLARIVHRLVPDDGEATGLLALMLLTDARRPARAGPDGAPIPMSEQDRGRWNAGYVAEGIALLSEALPNGPTGQFQIQAAIAALHDEAPSAEETDWPQIEALYEVLLRLSDNPVVALNHAVAVGMARGPREGLAALEELGDRISGDHRFHAARAHLLEMAGDIAEAIESYVDAARLATGLPHRRYLHARAERLR
ncbi:Putative ECF subfamily RNA polymerase sigma-24 subunit [Amycolatopsis japonica]|uniref:Putative ECF subfamily RNA polymerase sigma-24 subunit n=1 Tax=Amycolatopsis japonica TaxID=208439 RepID=A0A075UUZ7_9PSEU|nr:sigma-70 family RNA polymerase sigma factor [Amycolatopsis japonica]AIG74075.1 Putative ECF subfamily RNA polymerase sigma-24 subunit [Amycolatopsis japonica]